MTELKPCPRQMCESGDAVVNCEALPDGNKGWSVSSPLMRECTLI